MSKTTKKLCYIALLVAVYVLLSMTRCDFEAILTE